VYVLGTSQDAYETSVQTSAAATVWTLVMTVTNMGSDMPSLEVPGSESDGDSDHDGDGDGDEDGGARTENKPQP